MAKVALESTIISHGMPYPHNFQTAVQVEAMVRNEGAEPITIGVIGGEIRVGMSQSEIDRLAKTGRKAMKLGVKDLPIAMVKGMDGGTTVSATMFLAERDGIDLFATGGIGGVHRGAEQSFDVSSDLTELRRSSVAVVSSGCKSILDVPKTIEMLETLAIPIIGYQTKTVPLFYCRDSDHPVDLVCETPREIAQFLKKKRDLGLKGGVLIVNAPPKEVAMDRKTHDEALLKALAAAESKKILGKEVTPFLLEKMGELTDGKSLETNIALIQSNGKLAAKIAIEWEKLK